MRQGPETPALPRSMRAPGASEIPVPQPAWLKDGGACRIRDTPRAYRPWKDLSQPLRKQEAVGRARVSSECLRFVSFVRERLYQHPAKPVYSRSEEHTSELQSPM